MNPTRDRRIQTLSQMEYVPTRWKGPTWKPRMKTLTWKPTQSAAPAKPKSRLDELPDWVGMILVSLVVGFFAVICAAAWWDALRLSTEGRSAEATIAACEFRQASSRRISYRVTCEASGNSYSGSINLTAFHEFWPHPKPECGPGCGSFTYQYNLPSPRTVHLRYLSSDPSVVMVGKGGDSAWTLMCNNHGCFASLASLYFAIGVPAQLLWGFFRSHPTPQKTQS